VSPCVSLCRLPASLRSVALRECCCAGFAGNKIDAVAVCAVVDACASLTHVDLAYSNIADEGVAFLASLEFLAVVNLSYTNVGNAGVSMLGR